MAFRLLNFVTVLTADDLVSEQLVAEEPTGAVVKREAVKSCSTQQDCGKNLFYTFQQGFLLPAVGTQFSRSTLLSLLFHFLGTSQVCSSGLCVCRPNALGKCAEPDSFRSTASGEFSSNHISA